MLSPMLRATVVVRTRQHGPRLVPTVTAALHQAAAAGADVLVIDDAGTDEAAAVLADLAATHPGRLRVVLEPEDGASPARSRALRETTAPLLAFLDDDVVPAPGWLPALLAPLRQDGVWAVGGPIRLAFEAAPPAWLTPDLHPALGAWSPATRDLTLRAGRPSYPHDANLAVRSDALRLVGGFPAASGRHGQRQWQPEAVDLCHRLEHAGGRIRFAATAVVDRQVDPERTTPDWFLARCWHGGQAAADVTLRDRGLVAALWRLQWSYGKHLLQLPHHPRPPIDGPRLAAECRRREALGYLVELAHRLPVLPRWRPDGANAPAPVQH